MKKKKILQISTTTLQYDGLTKVIFSLIDNCDKALFDVDLLLGKGTIEEFKKLIEEKKLCYYEVPDRELEPLKYYQALYKILKFSDYDVVHIHGNSATMALDLFVAKMCGIKKRIPHSHNTKTNHPYIHRLLQPILKGVTTTPVACGYDAGKFLYGNSRFEIIPNCIKVDKYRFNENIRYNMRKALKYDETDFVIGHVGRFRYQKNHEYLIEMFYRFSQECEKAKLLLIGDADSGNCQIKDQTIARVNQLGIEEKVCFVGSTDKVNEYLQAMDCFVLPSHYEGLSITAIEAQASGLPCLLSNQMSEDTKLTDDCWLLPLSDSYQEWINKLKELQQNVFNRMESAKQVIAAGYDIDKLSSVINDIWS